MKRNATERTYGPFLGRPTHNRKGRRAQGPVATGALLLPRIGYFSFRHRQKLSPTSVWVRRRVFGSADQDMRDLQLDFLFIGHKAQGSRAKRESPIDNRTSSTTRTLLRRQPRVYHSLLMTNPASQGIRPSLARDIASLTSALLNPVGNHKVGEKSKREYDQRRQSPERYRH